MIPFRIGGMRGAAGKHKILLQNHPQPTLTFLYLPPLTKPIYPRATEQRKAEPSQVTRSNGGRKQLYGLFIKGKRRKGNNKCMQLSPAAVNNKVFNKRRLQIAFAIKINRYVPSNFQQVGLWKR